MKIKENFEVNVIFEDNKWYGIWTDNDSGSDKPTRMQVAFNKKESVFDLEEAKQFSKKVAVNWRHDIVKGECVCTLEIYKTVKEIVRESLYEAYEKFHSAYTPVDLFDKWVKELLQDL